MASIYDEKARDVLKEMAAGDFDPAKFRETLNALLPAWETSCSEGGYRDPNAETLLKVSRALHQSLPKPFNMREYLWREQHGFKEILFYVGWPERKSTDIAALVDAAIVHCNAIIENN